MQKEVDNMELLFDVFEASIGFLYEKTKQSYFNLFFMSCDNILSGEICQNLTEEDTLALEKIYEPIKERNLNVEEIRKALQSIILRGFKETKMNNGAMTPDTIGLLVSYFISKFEPKENKEIRILDPIAGTGNLVFTLENHLNLVINSYAIENNELLVKIMQKSSEMLQSDLKIYFEDTLKSALRNMDYLVGDFDYYDVLENGAYFPYECILHHIGSLKDQGIMIFCIPDDFFSYDINQNFKKELTKKASIIGLIELPDEMFNKDKKSILIIKKEVLDDKKCLMVKLPSFNDAKEFSNALTNIEMWFEKNINKRSEEN